MTGYNGAWLHMSMKTLEALCTVNYNTPPPHPVDTSAMLDLLKIRRLFEEAGALAAKISVEDRPSVGTSRASPRRNQIIREKACHALGEAYRLDDVITSVLVRTFKLDWVLELAATVLRRNPDNLDAKYIHYFQEELTDDTSLDPLRRIIEAGHAIEVLRTRAVAYALQGKSEEAVRDLTNALRQNELVRGFQTLSVQPPRRSRPGVPIPENAKADSIRGQLLFYRGSMFLQMAWRKIPDCFPPGNLPTTPSVNDSLEANETTVPPIENARDEVLGEHRESQKLVRKYAKNAMRDIMKFLSRFQYSPDWPFTVAQDLFEYRLAVASGTKASCLPSPRVEHSSHTNSLYTVSSLFKANPPSDLPPYPPLRALPNEESETVADIMNAVTADVIQYQRTSCESVTYHPLLIETLHSLLLCHCLLQTSPKEIQRHAYMVARLTRLCDGFPLFETCSPSSR